MNRLRELLDATPIDPYEVNHWRKQDIDLLYGATQVMGEQAQCFYIGNIADFDNFRIIPELALLPYKTCWFEFDADTFDDLHITIGTLMFSINENIHMIVWTKTRHKWSMVGSAKMASLTTSDVAILPTINAGFDILFVRNVVAGTLSVLNCKNVSVVQNDPPEKLQKAREKRGKKPLFSYWTLHIAQDHQARSHSHGGTHASPRVHLRRGHFREYKPGEYTWVQPHVVIGNGEGIVNKDYAVTKHHRTKNIPLAISQEESLRLLNDIRDEMENTKLIF